MTSAVHRLGNVSPGGEHGSAISSRFLMLAAVFFVTVLSSAISALVILLTSTMDLFAMPCLLFGPRWTYFNTVVSESLLPLLSIDVSLFVVLWFLFSWSVLNPVWALGHYSPINPLTYSRDATTIAALCSWFFLRFLPFVSDGDDDDVDEMADIHSCRCVVMVCIWLRDHKLLEWFRLSLGWLRRLRA